MSDRLRFPFAPGAMRDALKSDAELTRFVPAHLISTRQVPARIDRPFITNRPNDSKGADPKLRMSVVQTDVWVPKFEILSSGPSGIRADPEEVAWDLAALCGEIASRPKGSHSFRGASWSGEWFAGPGAGPSVDTSRGEDMPLYRALVRTQMTWHLREVPKFHWDNP